MPARRALNALSMGRLQWGLAVGAPKSDPQEARVAVKCARKQMFKLTPDDDYCLPVGQCFALVLASLSAEVLKQITRTCKFPAHFH